MTNNRIIEIGEAAIECAAALDAPHREGVAILESHGWDHQGRREVSASEFVRRKLSEAQKAIDKQGKINESKKEEGTRSLSPH